MTAQLPLHSAGSLPTPATTPLVRIDRAATAAVRALAAFARTVAATGGSTGDDVDRVWLIGTELGAIAQRAVDRAATGNQNQGED